MGVVILLSELYARAKNLPEKPGVYLMKDAKGNIIYVGKAKVLKNRVSQYFASQSRHDAKTRLMVSLVCDFDYIVTGSEYEALVLENSQIKLFKPRYNILLKDDKTYPYIRLNLKKPYARLEFTRKVEEDGARYFGPYSGDVRSIIATVNKAFLLPTCKRVFPRDIGRERPCLNYFIKQCAAPCNGGVSESDHREMLDEAAAFLSGNYVKVIKSIKSKMESASEELMFERAARLRDQMKALENLHGKQKVMGALSLSQDVIGLMSDGVNACFQVFHIRKGLIVDRGRYLMKAEDISSAQVAMGEFLMRFYGARQDLPREVLINARPEDSALIARFLSDKAGRKVTLTVPQRGVNRDRVAMVCDNAAEALERLTSREEKSTKALIELQGLLGLPGLPSRIEAVDISNTGGSMVVGALITFADGLPSKGDYKKYRIKGFAGQDDYGAIREIIGRRFKRYIEGSEGFDELPDLLLIDGGKGHVSAARAALDDLGVALPVYGMVKDDKHRTRALTTSDDEVELGMTGRAYKLVYAIQEEVHRFALAYHKSLRSSGIKSRLLEVPGLGEARVKALLREFKSLKGVRAASVDELAAVKGVGRAAALEIKRYFGDGDGADGA